MERKFLRKIYGGKKIENGWGKTNKQKIVGAINESNIYEIAQTKRLQLLRAWSVWRTQDYPIAWEKPFFPYGFSHGEKDLEENGER